MPGQRHLEVFQKKRIIRKNHEVYRCSYCDFLTASEDALETHITKHRGQRHLEVFQKKRIVRRNNISKQKSFRSENEVYHCTSCDFLTASEDALETHMTNHKEKKVFTRSGDHKRTLENEEVVPIVEERKRYDCPCTFSTFDREEMLTHFNGHESQLSCLTERSGLYQCCHCSFRTKMRLEMENHLLTEANNRRHFINGLKCDYPKFYSCDICGAKINDLERFELHRQYMHAHKLQCPQCNKRFLNCNVLLNHVKTHKKEHD